MHLGNPYYFLTIWKHNTHEKHSKQIARTNIKNQKPKSDLHMANIDGHCQLENNLTNELQNFNQ